jgi:hypothetical protein
MARFDQQSQWQERFAALLPVILGYVTPAFRHLGPEAKAEAVQEALANCCVAYWRLVQQGREGLAFATVLARYAVAQVRSGRQVGGRLNIQDVSSGYAQGWKQFRLARLDRFDSAQRCWREALVEDYRTPVADQAAFRCDFPAWLKTLLPRDRKIARALAGGERTTDVARRFHVSLARVSQLRRKFERSWLAFHGEEAENAQRGVLLQAA